MDLLTDKGIHRPLTEDRIRLLTLLPGLLNDPIYGELEHVSLSAKHTYEALSYVWGDASDTSSMILDRTLYPITKNLECALRYLRSKEAPRVLWVDAICINQDDQDEKSEQVPMMGEIYSRATKVYAWLGEADRQINCIFDILQDDLDDDILHEEFNWLRALYMRPYWRRVWIVQELVLAK
ncbi:HET-domain-containing protein, partial [Decorospora gaudefroyi]